MGFRKITCILDPRTVMKIRTEKKLDAVETVLTQLKDGLKGSFVAVIDRQYNLISVLVSGEEQLSDEKLGNYREVIAHALGVETVQLKTAEVSDEDAAKFTNIPADDSGKASENIKNEPAREEPEVKKDSKESKEAILKKVNDLIGAEEFKKLASTIYGISEYYTDKEALRKVLCSMSYLISVNKGGGRTTVAGLLADIVTDVLGIGRVKINKYDVSDQKRNDGSSEIDPIIRNVLSAPESQEVLTVFVFHIDEMQNKLNSVAWLELMQAARKSGEKNNKLYIFMAPYLEDIALSDIHRKINDALCNKTIKIPPFNNEMYITAFDRFFAEYGMTLSGSAHDNLLKKIAEEKSDGSFYGINTVKKIVSEVLYYKAQNNKNDPKTVTAEDIAILLEDTVTDGVSGFDRLDSLVSLDVVKEKVREILATIKLKRKMGDTKALSMHMMFSGAPGTGKTVVARLIGRIFKEEHILSKGDFYEVTRKDLVGAYVGHTAPKTAEVCKAAYGSVLFIDEAYSLAGGSDNDFGKEAISTLIAEMENNRDNMIVIFAGYENELKSLFELNPGLRDRIPYHISFKNYTRDELVQIFYMGIPSNFTYDDEFSTAANDFFANLPDEVLSDPNFSNGRYVRNLIERIFSKAALRMTMEQNAVTGVLTVSDFNSAVSDSDFSVLNQKKVIKKHIGF